MRSVYLIITLLFSAFCLAAVTNDDMKQELIVTPDISSVTGAEISIADNDNSSSVQLGLTEKTPVISEEFEAFGKMNISTMDYLFFGPYANFDGELKFKRRIVDDEDDKDTQDNSYFLLNKINGKLDAGFKIGLEATKKDLKGSSVYFYVPFSAVFLGNNSDSRINRDITINETDFFTYFYAGAGAGLSADFESDKLNIDASFTEEFTFGFEPIVPTYRSSPSSYIKNSTEVSFFVAPFNFISDKVNIYAGVKDKFEIEKMYYSTTFSNKGLVSLYWKPVKGFKLTINPVIYEYEVSLEYTTNTLYGQEQKVSGEVAFSISGKNLGGTFSIEPTFWAMEKADINTDELKTVTFKVELEIK